MKKVPSTKVKVAKISLIKLFRYFLPCLKQKQTNSKCSKTLCNFFPFLNDVISNLLHDNIGFVFYSCSYSETNVFGLSVGL